MTQAPNSHALPSEGAARPPRQRTKRLALLVAVPLIAGLAVLFLYLKGGRYVDTDNAYVKADKVPVSAEVAGAIQEVLVRENQAVTAGQLLFRLDPAPFQVAVAKSEARLAQVRTDLAALKAGYREKQAEITLARTKYAFVLKEQRRQADLAAKNFISAARLDEARQNTELAAQEIVTREQDLKRIAETLGGSVDTPVERHPGYLVALAELQQARLDLSRVEVRAALPGTVSKPPKPGQYVAAGATAMALVVNGNLWIEANFTETDLTYVVPGQLVAIHVDTYPDAQWTGVVESLSPATGAEFSVIPAQNATGNWVKIAQRVPLRIKLEARPGMPQLRAGLSSSVEIDTGHRRRLLGFTL
ncbi:MAG TPA: HlyD family secretion protein [Paucimonas sp.]|nr:HlyD family secretion protein [Paucimonas sp.]HJW55909.1 HlyD family secretion protein [Burkholderiaceae bacterium]